MAEVIPGIIEDAWEPLAKRLASLDGKTEWVHLDVSDGVFTSHETWAEPGDLLSVKTDLLVEVHMMVVRPWEYVAPWAHGPVRRVIVHYEAFKDSEERIAQGIERGHARGLEIVLAVNPPTSADAVRPYFERIDAVLVMGVEPGWSGAAFHPEIVEKIKVLRDAWPDGIIEVDGGVNAERAGVLVRSGANRLVSSSFVFSFNDPAEGIRALQNAAQPKS